jgi:hypothetical protein
MTNEEREAFAAAYANHVAHLSADEVMEFLDLYYGDEKKLYGSENYTSIVDALGIWQEAIKWKLMKLKDHA